MHKNRWKFTAAKAAPALALTAATAVPVLMAAALATGCQVAEASELGVERTTQAMELDGYQLSRSALGTGLIGIGPGQTALLHVSRLHAAEHPPDPGLPPDLVDPPPGQLLLSFVGGNGRALAEQVVELNTGRSATLRFDNPGGRRLLLRAAINGLSEVVPPDDGVEGVVPPDDGLEGVAPPDDGSPADDALSNGGIQATLEVLDSRTGESALVITPGQIFGFNPQPEPPALVAR